MSYWKIQPFTCTLLNDDEIRCAYSLVFCYILEKYISNFSEGRKHDKV
jgi:hypothetical protein